jgi:tetratricopeptide (TPR) repeat protein
MSEFACWPPLLFMNLTSHELDLGYRYLAAGDTRAAKRIVTSVLDQGSENGPALHLAGLIAYQSGELSSAADFLRQASRLIANDAHLYAHQGAVCGLLGQRREAEGHFRRAIELDPSLADGHYNLGKILQDDGRVEEAIISYKRAIELRPTYVQALFNLATALSGLGRLADAAALYEQALRLKPDYTKALNNLGNTRLQLGDPEQAIAMLDRAIDLRPDYAEAHHNRGNALRALRDWEGAVAAYRRALDINSALPKTHAALADLLKDQQHVDQAVIHYRRAIHFYESAGKVVDGRQLSGNTPAGRSTVTEFDLVRVWNNLGSCLVVRLEWNEAEACFHYVLSLDSLNATAINNLGVIRMAHGRLDEAQRQFEHAVGIDGKYAEAWSNLGAALQNQGKYGDAAKKYERSLGLNENLADGRWNRSLLWLAQGDWKRGWPEYEWRWQRPEFFLQQFRRPGDARIRQLAQSNGRQPRQLDLPTWDGSPLDGRNVLLFAEQGLGDVIQFVRFARVAKQRGGRVVVECPGRMISLLRSCAGVDEWVAQGDEPPACDVQLALMSVPAAIGLTMEALASEDAYLKAEFARMALWKAALGRIPGFKIGVNWQGNPSYNMDRFRSLPLAEFRPLTRVPGVTLVSLQQGFGAEQATDVRELFPVVTLDGELDRDGAFLDTAAILTLLDLVVTSDTALAHLAGALGVATWVVLPYAADWRWRVAGETTPWYPTMRLFRQPRPGDWKGVFRRVAEELKTQVEGQTGTIPAQEATKLA